MKFKFENQEFKVFWKHYNLSQTDWNVNNGGTTCTIIGEGFKADGKAICVKTDQFNKRTGRVVSLTKALRNMPKDFRKIVWEQYKTEIGFK